MSISDLPEPTWLWMTKLAGAVAGSAVSLAYILPKGRREAAARFATGVVCGLVFGGAAGVKIASELGISEMIGEGELTLMGSAAASLFAWWAVGWVVRGLRKG
jgi:hypothetical protein